MDYCRLVLPVFYNESIIIRLSVEYLFRQFNYSVNEINNENQFNRQIQIKNNLSKFLFIKDILRIATMVTISISFDDDYDDYNYSFFYPKIFDESNKYLRTIMFLIKLFVVTCTLLTMSHESVVNQNATYTIITLCQTNDACTCTKSLQSRSVLFLSSPNCSVQNANTTFHYTNYSF